MIIRSAVNLLEELDKKECELHRVYLLLTGADEYLKEQIVEKIKSRFLEGQDSSFSVDVFYADSYILKDFIESVSSPSFFGKKIIILKNAEELKESDFVKIFSAQIPESSILVVISSSEKKPAAVSEDLVVVDDYSVDNEMKMSWIKMKFKSMGKEVSKEAINGIIERLDDNFSIMDKEISKICLYVGDKKKVDKSDIEEVVEYYSEVDIYNFINLILEKKVIELLKAFESFIKTSDAFQIQILMGHLLRSLLSMLVMKDVQEKESRRKFNYNELHKEIFGYFLPKEAANNLKRLGENYSKSEILKIYSDFLELDFKNKSGEVELPLSLMHYFQTIKLR